MNLLDDALRVSRTTRKTWLSHLSDEQRAELQAQMTARASELGIEPTKPAATTIDQDRYNSIRSGSFIGGKRAVKVGRHIVMLPAAAKYKRTRDTLVYTYHRGVVGGYVAKGAKLSKLKLDGPTRAHIARTFFNVRT
ncbi:hypothetical protein ACFU0W_11730 [Microbacterium keratanolyticum]|uniref:hypothetical protein n=1 Tax=Microbacterium keratanolyticum TaxID=67574 RepID=UPI003638395A